MSLASFYIKVKNERPELAKITLKFLFSFLSIFFYETGFSTFFSVIRKKKTETIQKYLSSTQPWLDNLTSRKQAHLSHSKL